MINTDNIDFTSFYNSARELCEMYKQELESQRVNASGELSRSVDFDVDFDDDSITLYFNMAMYWYYIEKGRNATGGGGGQSWGYPKNVNDIAKWMQDKISRGWFIPRANQTIPRTDKEIKRVAYAIVKKIHKVGFYGQNHYGLHILEQVLNKAEASGLIDKMVQSVVNGYDKEISVELQKI